MVFLFVIVGARIRKLKVLSRLTGAGGADGIQADFCLH